MKVLVTGANGLIGVNLVRVLVREGVSVRAFVRTSSDLTYLKDLPVDIVYGDVTEPGSLSAAVEGVEVLFHSAVPFTYTGRTAQELEGTALSGTENVLRAAKDSSVKRTVVTSSSVVFGYSETKTIRDERSGLADGNNQAPYIVAKIKQNRHTLALAGEFGIDVVLVCPAMSVGAYGTTVGPSNGIVLAYLNDPWRFTYPGGCNIVSVTDVAYGHWQAALYGVSGEHYILGSENLEWREIHGLIAELCGVQGPQFQLNHALSYLGATAEEIRAWMNGASALTTREQAAMVGRYYWYSHDKAAALGYKPRPARTALAETISWLATSPHMSREVRTTLRLHRDVYSERRAHVHTRSVS
jgi:dihydroflavonol-4-reductase